MKWTSIAAIIGLLILIIGCGGGGSGTGGTNTSGGNTNGGNTTGGSSGGSGGSSGGTSGGSTAGVSGRVTAEGFPDLGVTGAKITFFNAAGAAVGSFTADSAGNFSGFIDPTASKIFILKGDLPQGYWNSFTYQNKRYSILDQNCKPGIPTLSGGTTSIGNVYVPLQSSPPPPPPSGCP